MIPRAYLQSWRRHAPWPDLRQVEQDLLERQPCAPLLRVQRALKPFAQSDEPGEESLIFSTSLELAQVMLLAMGRVRFGLRAVTPTP